MEPELLHSGEVEKWSRTARGMAWRLFHVSVTTREIRWRVASEASQEKVFLGSISVPRIVNAKVDPNSARGDGVHTVFVVQEPAEDHEFRTDTLEQAQHWVQHIKNATLPKTRRKWPTPVSTEVPTAPLASSVSLPLTRTNSNGSSHGSLASAGMLDSNAMVTEIHGQRAVQRPVSETDNATSKSTNDLTTLSFAPFNTTTIGLRKRLKDSFKIRKRNSLTLMSSFEEVFTRPVAPTRDSVSSDTDVSERCDESPIVREGYLIKQGNMVKNWRRRWFTLSRSYLIYREEEGTPTKGQIRMCDIKLTRRSERYPDKRFLFEVITSKRTYYMMASSQDEMDGWTDAISHILKNPSDTSSLGSSGETAS